MGLFLSLKTLTSFYIIYCSLVLLCIATLAVFVIIFGRRARRNVRDEKITSLADGFSPLDIKRIFIGKTYPRKLTRALIVHWANCGYIKVKYVNKHRVRVTKIADMPRHDSEDALFFDRGVYARECEYFKLFARKIRHKAEVDLRHPLFTKADVKSVNMSFAVREDEGVYSAKHYSLKIFSIIISIIPFALTEIWIGTDTGVYMGIIFIFTAIIGLMVLMFVNEMPILFKLIWCGMWLGVSIGATIAYASASYDPFGAADVSAILLLLGPLFIIRFIDYREKNNLDDYSDLINYRKFLLHAPTDELNTADYIKALPFIYAFGIKPFVKRRFTNRICPDWYSGDKELKGALL